PAQAIARRNQSLQQTNVPSQAQRQGNLTARVDGRPEAAITDPLTRQPFPGNIIPSSRFSSTMQRVLQYYPLPNQSGAINYRTLVPLPRDEDAVLGKFDHIFSAYNRFTARYLYQETDSVSAIPVIADFGTRTPTRTQNVALTDTHIFSPTTLLDTRISWNRQILKEFSPRVGSSFDVRKEFGMIIPSTAVPGAFENEIPNFA